MSQDPRDDAKPSTSEPKLPYERPAVISEEVFETLALSCANMIRVCAPSDPNQS